MDEDLPRLLSLTRAALKDLASGNGTTWKEAVGELQSQYNEIVLWVLLYEDGDLVETHAALRRTLQPHMAALAPLQVVLYYETIVNAQAYGAKLSGNDAVFSTATDSRMDLNWYPLASNIASVFEAKDSKRPG